ncbi:hypothetical protein G9A89_021858 [Geosiphon pyriformis]|nr:hypothetical protein G9A89_021858 [Geosiphon pyriformis]
MVALKTLPDLSITINGSQIKYIQKETTAPVANHLQNYHLYRRETRSHSENRLPRLLKQALEENLLIAPIDIPPNATMQQKLLLLLNEQNNEHTPIYKYFQIGKTLYERKLELKATNLTPERPKTSGNSRKTCVIECNSVNYTRVHCNTVCFKSESDLNQALANTLVIKGVSLHWLRLFAALCSSCNSLGHISRNCKSAGVSSSPKSKRASLLAQNWFKLAKIYEKKFAPVSHHLAFGEKTWASVLGSIENDKPLPPVVNDLKKHLVSIKSSLVSLVRQIGKLAKRLEPFNQEKDIVIGVGLGDATSDKTVAVSGSTASPKVVKLENMLEGLSASVMSLLACLDGLALASGAPFLPLFQ